MAIISVDMNANQIIGAKDHFGETDNKKALALFTEWLNNHLNQWYADYKAKDIAVIYEALKADPTKIAAVLAVLQPK